MPWCGVPAGYDGIQDWPEKACGGKMTEQGSDAAQDESRRALRRAALLTSGAGILYGVLSITAWYLMREGRLGLAESGDPEAYYAEGGLFGSELAALYLLPFAAILFLWFIVALRGWIRGTQHRRNMLISDLQLVSGVVFIAVFLVGAAAVASALIITQAEDGGLSMDALRVLAGFGNTLMVVMGVRVASIFVMATASLGMTTGVLPRWFNYMSYGFGLVLMLTPIVEAALIVAFPVWVIALSIMLLYHLANLPADEIPGFAARHLERKRGAEAGALD
jgi:hypothetical protein